MLAGFSIELGQALAQALRPEKDITAQAHFFPQGFTESSKAQLGMIY